MKDGFKLPSSSSNLLYFYVSGQREGKETHTHTRMHTVVGVCKFETHVFKSFLLGWKTVIESTFLTI